MPTTPNHAEVDAGAGAIEAFGDVSAAVEAGAGLPEVARAASRALDASVAVVDASSSVLAVACASPEDERRLLSRPEGTGALALRVADASVGEMLYRPRGAPPPAALVRMVGAVIGLEVERSRGPERATREAVRAFLADLLDRRVTDREDIVARGREFGADLAGGASVMVVRARPAQPEAGDWRARVLAVAERGARAAGHSVLAGAVGLGLGRSSAAAERTAAGASAPDGELVLVVAAPDPDAGAAASGAVLRALEASFGHHRIAVARSRPAADPADLHRAGAEAVLAANVAEAHGGTQLAFEETGAYRLLLPAMSDDAGELERFHEETVAAIVAYDEQYETELVRTLESFLDEDGSVAKTAQRLFTHRHTIRYRLERVRELTGLDVGSTDGRERLGLGLKAMRVLGIQPPHGPATERGAEAGQVPRHAPDR